MSRVDDTFSSGSVFCHLSRPLRNSIPLAVTAGRVQDLKVVICFYLNKN